LREGSRAEGAPIYLKEVSRIQALLCVYFLAMLTESLLERELRRAMDRGAIESLPLYPEGRRCCRPTARRIFDLFDDVQRHSLRAGRRPPVAFTTDLSRLQRRLVRLLGMKNVYNESLDQGRGDQHVPSGQGRRTRDSRPNIARATAFALERPPISGKIPSLTTRSRLDMWLWRRNVNAFAFQF
jgi:hypothetical protein